MGRVGVGAPGCRIPVSGTPTHPDIVHRTGGQINEPEHERVGAGPVANHPSKGQRTVDALNMTDPDATPLQSQRPRSDPRTGILTPPASVPNLQPIRRDDNP